MAIAVAIVALICSIQIRKESRLLQELEDSGHGLLFGLAAISLLPDRKAGWRIYAAVAIAATILGIAVELVQWIAGKDAEVGDVFRDAAGAAVFLGVAWAFQNEYSARMRRLVVLAGIAIMASIFSPPLLTASAIIARWHKFPVIADFSSSLDTRLCSASNARFRRIYLKKRFAGLVEFNKRAQFSAFAIIGPFPDWSRYKYLAFRVDSDKSKPIHLYLRINDAEHNNDYADRYNAQLLILPGGNDIRIPLEAIKRSPGKRQMNMKAIHAIVLFVMQPEESFPLVIDDFRLEGNS